jgi:hypothetical protein
MRGQSSITTRRLNERDEYTIDSPGVLKRQLVATGCDGTRTSAVLQDVLAHAHLQYYRMCWHTHTCSTTGCAGTRIFAVLQDVLAQNICSTTGCAGTRIFAVLHDVLTHAYLQYYRMCWHTNICSTTGCAGTEHLQYYRMCWHTNICSTTWCADTRISAALQDVLAHEYLQYYRMC